MNKSITNLNKRKPIVDQFWKKNGYSETSLSQQLAEVEGKILDKSINLIENSPIVTEEMTQGSSHNTHHVKPQTISSTLSMNKFKKNSKPKTSKYQNKITKETVPYVSSEPLHLNNICLYRSKASSDLADPQLYFLIKNLYKPHKTFDFPETDRHFRFVWFQEFPWLCYSRWEDGAYCLYYVLFGQKSTSYSRMKNLYSQPSRKWPVAVKPFKEHANTKSGVHSDSKIHYYSFLDQYKGRELPVNKMVDSNYKTNVKRAREAIAPIVDIVKLCGRQNIPLWGHRDSGKNQPKLGECGLNNTGNFIELLNYRIRGGDKTLENHLRCAQQNAKYTSPEILNDLILCCRDLIVEKLVVDVKESKYYTILADEATDCSLKEQIALILRFADESSTIREEFVSFLECSYGLSGQLLFKIIKEFLDSNGIDISD